MNIQTIDPTNIQNNFIYNLVDYYLEEISSQPPDNILQSVANITNTIMSYYLLVQKNSQRCATDITDSCLDENNLSQCKELEKYLVSTTDKSCQNNLSPIVPFTLTQIDELLDDHEKFMLDISKQSSVQVNPTNNDNNWQNSQSTIIPENTITDISPIKNTNIISQSAIEIMTKDSTAEKHMDKLDEAFDKLYSRINTPFINLIIIVVVLKFATYLFGF